MSKTIRCYVLGLVLFSGTLFAGDPAFYVRKATWNETMRASREALLKLRGNESEFQKNLLGPWYSIGPFKGSGGSVFSQVFPPEKEIDLTKSYNNGSLRWENKSGWADGSTIDLGPESTCAIYLFRTMTVPRDTILPASLGSDDGIKVWVNGVEILANNVNRGVHPDQEFVDLVLNKGRTNSL